MNIDRLAAVARALDAAVSWHMAPKWRRGKLIARMVRAYQKPSEWRAK